MRESGSPAATSKPEASAISFTSLLEDLVERARIVDGSRTVTLVEPEGETSAWVSGNRVLLDRAIWNLVDNALKFGKPGSRIEIRMLSDGTTVEIQVADDGPGLREPDSDVLFEAFRRGSAAARVPGGHGLGLPLSQSVIRRHAGVITARPDARLGGACFVVRLPRARLDLLVTGSRGSEAGDEPGRAAMNRRWA
jgi:signal transduction histidine kinase